MSPSITIFRPGRRGGPCSTVPSGSSTHSPCCKRLITDIGALVRLMSGMYFFGSIFPGIGASDMTYPIQGTECRMGAAQTLTISSRKMSFHVPSIWGILRPLGSSDVWQGREIPSPSCGSPGKRNSWTIYWRAKMLWVNMRPARTYARVPSGPYISIGCG